MVAALKGAGDNMQPQIITVHDIHAAIKDVGILPYANTVVRDMAGQYYFVDTETIDNPGKDLFSGLSGWEIVGLLPESDDGKVVYMKYRVSSIPLKIAHFIIQAMRLKSQAMNLHIPPVKDEDRESMAVYLTPGKEFMGNKVEKLTEIPAELLPVTVERL